MKVSVNFKTDKLPVAYRLGMLSIIKECLKNGAPEIYELYFTSHIPKPYTFSVYLQNYKFQETDISLTGFQLNITSPDYQFMIPFLNGLQKINRFQYKHYHFQRELIRFAGDQEIRSNRILVQTLSPILVEDEQHKPLSPHDPAYNQQFQIITERISQSLRGKALRSPVTIRPVSVKKTVIKEQNDSYLRAREEKRVSGDYLFFTAYSGRFILEGDPVDLQWLVDSGCGLRSGQGFGHIQLESEVNP
ncbi:CRISPR associated protein Cas6 [Sporotomaculum syntrophicum]|uniref:CRISPR associated protein Cas6 n=1 Tax=Sporotomaculum syntrophicum TaxID=182264 RepID=A0A9D2WMZ3_9FIRM|nr:CRISPR-associated endoribonuclease Cas6 [Sporotomaculum syntrophicum]KAF1083736.1 CRISPR associated protein Cas6 [Sporotomaculum syntrophicum]